MASCRCVGAEIARKFVTQCFCLLRSGVNPQGVDAHTPHVGAHDLANADTLRASSSIRSWYVSTYPPLTEITDELAEMKGTT